jgi:RHS repeat-associated protein
VRLVVDVADGSVVQRIDYDEYGRELVNTNPGFQPFGYAGGLADTHTGLVRFGVRDYEPQAGRWAAKDPLLLAGGSSNLYEYARNDPTNEVDPTGNQVAVGPPPPVVVSPGAPAVSAPVVNPYIVGAAVLVGAIRIVWELLHHDHPDECEEDRIRRCEAQYEIEVGVCGALYSPRERSLCYQAALERLNACKRGLPLPPLPPFFARGMALSTDRQGPIDDRATVSLPSNEWSTA